MEKTQHVMQEIEQTMKAIYVSLAVMISSAILLGAIIIYVFW